MSKDTQPKHILIEDLKDPDFVRIAKLTHGRPLVSPPNEDNPLSHRIEGITYGQEVVVFDRNNHILEVRSTSGSRQFPTEGATVHQNHKGKTVVFRVKGHLGTSDPNEHRVLPSEIEITHIGGIRQTILFPMDESGYMPSKTLSLKQRFNQAKNTIKSRIKGR